MSKADEMFEKLNYAKTVLGYEKNKTIIYENWYIKIEFIEDGHYIKIKADDKLDMQELQAINEKIKELRLGKQLNKEIKSIKEKI